MLSAFRAIQNLRDDLKSKRAQSEFEKEFINFIDVLSQDSDNHNFSRVYDQFRDNFYKNYNNYPRYYLASSYLELMVLCSQSVKDTLDNGVFLGARDREHVSLLRNTTENLMNAWSDLTLDEQSIVSCRGVIIEYNYPAQADDIIKGILLADSHVDLKAEIINSVLNIKHKKHHLKVG